MNKDIQMYNDAQAADRKPICEYCMKRFIVACRRSRKQNLARSARLVFRWQPDCRLRCVERWRAASFLERAVVKAAEARYTSTDQIKTDDVQRWLKKSQDIQCDYKNIVKRGVLERLK